MLQTFLLIPLMIPTVPPPSDILTISARIEAEHLDVGKEYDFRLEAQVKEGWTASQSGTPRPLLQISVPDSVQLSGKVISGYRALSRNEFLREPFERLINNETTRVKFKLTSKPSKKDRFRFNVLAYVSQDGSDNSWFIRRRLALIIKPGAKAKIISKKHSGWGEGRELQLGDKAIPFQLPRADGTRLSLKRYLGKKNILITTYRAFW